jgi:putative ABC transport system permease protein
MLTYESWRTRFGGSSAIVGHPLTIGTKTFDIVGILPPAMVVPQIFGDKPELFIAAAPPARGEKGGTFYPVVRRNAGLSREQVQSRIDAVTKQVSEKNPRTVNLGPSLQEVRSVLFPVGRPIMKWLFAASALVLLLGCANLANMLLARSVRHERETGMSIALGASRARVLRPILFESAIVGLSGAAVALVVTSVLFSSLLKQLPRGAVGAATVGVDLRVVLLALATGLAAGVLFAIVPAWRSSRRDVQSLLLRRHARRSNRFGRPMVAVQVAMAVTLVFGAAVTTRAFIEVLRVPLGFDDANVVRLSVATMGFKGQALQDFYGQVIQQISSKGDVVAAGAASRVPFGGSAPDEGVRVPGRDGLAAGINHTLPGFFEALNVAPVKGRLLTWADAASDPNAAVVSVDAANTLFPAQDPIGQVFSNGRGREFHVVGVVPDIRFTLGSDRRDAPSTYVMPGADMRRAAIFVRLRTKSDAALAALRRETAAMTPGQTVTAVWWSDSLADVAVYKNPRFQTIVLGAFAVLALGLTALGVFAVVQFLVAARTREMGVRLAIGATPRSVVMLVVRQSLLPVAIGGIGGVVAAKLLGKLAEAQLFDVKTSDPRTLAVSAATVIVAALAAAYWPARRAGSVNPITVLRAE